MTWADWRMLARAVLFEQQEARRLRPEPDPTAYSRRDLFIESIVGDVLDADTWLAYRVHPTLQRGLRDHQIREEAPAA